MMLKKTFMSKCSYNEIYHVFKSQLGTTLLNISFCRHSEASEQPLFVTPVSKPAQTDWKVLHFLPRDI